MITKSDLRKAKPENVRRLAKWLDLHIDGMSDRQVIKLVHWYLTRRRYRMLEHNGGIY
jgi:hypothetical protein